MKDFFMSLFLGFCGAYVFFNLIRTMFNYLEK